MHSRPIDRWHFLGSAAGMAAFFAMHDLPASGFQGNTPAPARPRLLSLELHSGAPKDAMKAFYGKTLDLRIMNERADRFTVEAGETQITFVNSAAAVDGRTPFYHFAFNIPENKILKAVEWQKARTPLLSIPERNHPTAVTVRGAKTAKHTLAGYPHVVTVEERCSCA